MRAQTDKDKLNYAKAFVSRYLHNKPFLRHYQEDLVQEAFLGIMSAERCFRPETGASLASVQWRWMQCMINRCADRYIRKESRDAYETPKFLDEHADDEREYVGAIADIPDSTESQETQVAERNATEWFLYSELPNRVKARFKDGYRGRALEIARERLAGDTLQAIGTRHDVTREYVRQILAKLGLGD